MVSSGMVLTVDLILVHSGMIQSRHVKLENKVKHLAAKEADSSLSIGGGGKNLIL